MGDLIKGKYWQKIADERRRKPYSIILADKNAPNEDVWRRIEDMCRSTKASAVPVVPDSEGVYKLVPFYKGENTIFDVSPPSMLVIAGHDHTKVIQTFQVPRFSIGGRVVDRVGMGINGVKIIVDSEERSITDKEGYYKLNQVTSKRHTIEATKERYKFGKLSDFLICVAEELKKSNEK